MIHTGMISMSDLDNDLDDAGWSELESWVERQATMDTSEYALALQQLPTEQELLRMEAGQDACILDDRLLQGERRTAHRH